jgi:hypothetical protein
MPNGYTAAIYEGRDVSLREYLMNVGRSMGFAIMQRDDDPNAPVRLTEPQTKYHDDAIRKAEETLARVSRMTADEAQGAAADEYEQAIKHRREAVEQHRILRERYEAMIARVKEWEPEPLIARVKEQAIKYLLESMDFDCHGDLPTFPSEPVPKNGEQWVEGQVAKARREIEYHGQERAREIASTAERNAWISAFLRSLPDAEMAASP